MSREAARLRALAQSLRAEAAGMQRRPRDRMNAYADEALEVAVLLEATVPPVACEVCRGVYQHAAGCALAPVPVPTPPARIERTPSDP